MKEANRYLSNAKEILSEKAGRVNGSYTDKKYVRKAGHTAYMGVLLALEALVPDKNPKKAKRKSVEYYQEFLGNSDKKLFGKFNDLYLELHLHLGYDEVLNAKIVNENMNYSKEFIQKISARVN